MHAVAADVSLGFVKIDELVKSAEGAVEW